MKDFFSSTFGGTVLVLIMIAFFYLLFYLPTKKLSLKQKENVFTGIFVILGIFYILKYLLFEITNTFSAIIAILYTVALISVIGGKRYKIKDKK